MIENAQNSSTAVQPFAEHLFLKKSLEIQIELLCHPMFQVLFLLLIEIIIQQDLVWDKDTGKLTGYMNLGNTDLNAAVLDKTDGFASHVLLFLVRSIVNPLSIITITKSMHF